MIKKFGCLFFILMTAFNVYGNERAKPNIAMSVNVGEVNLYIECYGKGSPSIIVNGGFGGSVASAGWEKVIKSLYKKNQICIYDRANLGQSGKSVGHYDVKTIVEHQNVLLEKVVIQPPYLMIGHSYGSYPIKLFNHLFPEKVAAILLVDPSLYGQFKSHINKWDPENDNYDEVTRKKMEDELARWQGEPVNSEKINMRTSAKLIENSDGFGDKPYVLLWASGAIWKPGKNVPDGWNPAVWERIKRSYSADLAGMKNLSSNTKISFAKTPEHYIHKYEPEIVIDEVNYLLEKLNKH